MDFTSDMGARSSSESSMVSSTFGDSTTADFNEETEYLIRNEQKPAVRYNYTRQIFS
jgi:Rho-related BTB domain-containing protein 1/2